MQLNASLSAVQQQLQELQETHSILSNSHSFVKENLKPLVSQEISKTRNMFKQAKQDFAKEKEETLQQYASIREQLLSFTTEAREAVQRYRIEVEKRRKYFNMLEEIKGNIR